MITVRLSGGLGNQMFQYAAGKRLAGKHGTGLRLDVGGLANAETPRKYELGAFPVEAEVFRESATRSRALRLGRRLGLPLFTPPVVVTESTFKCDPRVLAAPAECELVGYFQSARYFEDDEAAVRRSFAFKPNGVASEDPFLDQLKGKTSVSIHVRRGDYLSAPGASQVHGVLPLSYYRAACEHLLQRHPEAHFFVFSDDPEWCKGNMLDIAPRVTCVEHDAATTAVRDMGLMARCRHHVIANSSFSWWSAWLNPSSEKVVIAPRSWFRDGSIDISDLFPSDWVQL